MIICTHHTHREKLSSLINQVSDAQTGAKICDSLFLVACGRALNFAYLSSVKNGLSSHIYNFSGEWVTRERDLQESMLDGLACSSPIKQKGLK